MSCQSLNDVRRVHADSCEQAHEHHRKHLESLPSTSYPLAPAGNPAEIPGAHLNAGGTETGATTPLQTASGAPYEQR